ncbi:putative ef hand domain-protein [Rhypophila decipiens]|uniref:Ef hand domain-protein n=1 Tax=Rhypophila decipiens TaxID=261697 RepID=A0AAN6YGX3_9PEZI|nr:putative ef hand domain-protein [Rhypophila decipiens]
MESSTAAASTLTRHRITLFGVASLAALTVGYLCYDRYWDYPDSSLPASGGPDEFGERLEDPLRRRNAVRHRRRSVPDIRNRNRTDRRTSVASSLTLDDASRAGDENAHNDDSNNNDNTLRPLADGETVADGADADEQGLDANWWADTSLYPQARAGQNIVNLLFRVSQDNAQRNAYVHRGCSCNACGILPIRGVRYRCANCADFDLCEMCESQGLHTKTHIFYKIRIPAPRLGPRHIQPVWYPGDPDNCIRTLPKQLITKLTKETGYERPELEAFWEQWTFTANTEWREDPDELCLAMDRKTFERYLVPSGGDKYTASNLLYDRMFAFYDTNNDDLIGFTEFLHGLAFRKRKDKLRRVFDGYDVDRDGYVNRRDFLRLFRAYYVLFKQMHRDVLEGLDEQVMGSTETHQLITGRQPLSSLFGREGGIPPGDADRPLEGKVHHSSGDILIQDGNNAIKEDKPDTADREAMLTSLFSREARFSENMFAPAMESSSSRHDDHDTRYFTGLLNPPVRVDELAAFLIGEARDRDDMFVITNDDDEDAETSEDMEDHDDANVENGLDVVGESAAGTRPTNHASQGPFSMTESEMNNIVRTYHRGSRAAKSKRNKANARRKLIERWKRRQFYLDEEEGARPPPGWDAEDDVLSKLETTGESSKSAEQNPPFLSTRSRSSSKVRFAEDMDDFDIRSNPSTSSRSVPERWGGMDIPDAERDVGKEVFYQVMQQAFNELLDLLFKKKEEQAVQAAETREQRNMYRSLFEAIDPNEEEQRGSESPTTSHRWSVEDVTKPIEEMGLPELLQATGYSINGTTENGEDHSAEAVSAEAASSGDKAGAVDDDSRQKVEDLGDDAASSESNASTYRDPTMPQFRPNSLSSTGQALLETLLNSKGKQVAAPATSSGPSSSSKTAPVSDSAATPATKGSGGPPITPAKDHQISRRTLVKWKQLDLAEEEARKRGGWGKLTYEEFEQIYRSEESKGNRLDYLGTWIDFCVPFH